YSLGTNGELWQSDLHTGVTIRIGSGFTSSGKALAADDHYAWVASGYSLFRITPADLTNGAFSVNNAQVTTITTNFLYASDGQMSSTGASLYIRGNRLPHDGIHPPPALAAVHKTDGAGSFVDTVTPAGDSIEVWDNNTLAGGIAYDGADMYALELI